jgi:hypothetical protein
MLCWITPQDLAFSSLRLWIDKNHNGVSEGNELKSLSTLGIEAISLVPRESQKRDRYGNLMRYAAPFLWRYASGNLVWRRAVDAYLVQQ